MEFGTYAMLGGVQPERGCSKRASEEKERELYEGARAYLGVVVAKLEGRGEENGAAAIRVVCEDALLRGMPPALVVSALLVVIDHHGEPQLDRFGQMMMRFGPKLVLAEPERIDPQMAGVLAKIEREGMIDEADLRRRLGDSVRDAGI